MGFYYFCGKFRETGTYKTLYKCLSSISAVHFSVFVVRPEIVTVSRWQGSAGSKMKKKTIFHLWNLLLRIYFWWNQSAAFASTGQKESGFSTPDNEKPKARSCKRTRNSSWANGLATTAWKRGYLRCQCLFTLFLLHLLPKACILH